MKTSFQLKLQYYHDACNFCTAATGTLQHVGPMGWIQRQMSLGINPEDILAYMVPHAQVVRENIKDLYVYKIM